MVLKRFGGIGQQWEQHGLYHGTNFQSHPQPAVGGKTRPQGPTSVNLIKPWVPKWGGIGSGPIGQAIGREIAGVTDAATGTDFSSRFATPKPGGPKPSGGVRSIDQVPGAQAPGAQATAGVSSAPQQVQPLGGDVVSPATPLIKSRQEAFGNTLGQKVQAYEQGQPMFTEELLNAGQKLMERFGRRG